LLGSGLLRRIAAAGREASRRLLSALNIIDRGGKVPAVRRLRRRAAAFRPHRRCITGKEKRPRVAPGPQW